MNCRKTMLAALCGAAVAMSATTASATSLMKLGFSELSNQADACVVATMLTSENTVVDGQAMTRTTWSVQKAAFGNVGETFTLLTPGGRIQNGKVSGYVVNAGSPRLLGGQESLMFLNASANGAYSITGYNQGLFVVREGKIASGDLAGEANIDAVLARAAAVRN